MEKRRFVPRALARFIAKAHLPDTLVTADCSSVAQIDAILVAGFWHVERRSGRIPPVRCVSVGSSLCCTCTERGETDAMLWMEEDHMRLLTSVCALVPFSWSGVDIGWPGMRTEHSQTQREARLFLDRSAVDTGQFSRMNYSGRLCPAGKLSALFARRVAGEMVFQAQGRAVSGIAEAAPTSLAFPSGVEQVASNWLLVAEAGAWNFLAGSQKSTDVCQGS